MAVIWISYIRRQSFKVSHGGFKLSRAVSIWFNLSHDLQMFQNGEKNGKQLARNIKYENVMKLHRHITTANLDDLERVLVTTKACTNDETTSLKLLLSPHKV